MVKDLERISAGKDRTTIYELIGGFTRMTDFDLVDSTSLTMQLGMQWTCSAVTLHCLIVRVVRQDP
jgi:hypothetical protein